MEDFPIDRWGMPRPCTLQRFTIFTKQCHENLSDINSDVFKREIEKNVSLRRIVTLCRSLLHGHECYRHARAITSYCIKHYLEVKVQIGTDPFLLIDATPTTIIMVEIYLPMLKNLSLGN